MAKFLKYYIRYKHCFGPHDWEQRQDHLTALFAKDDSITFGEGTPGKKQEEQGAIYAKEYKHRVYHLACNPGIIVMQFANSIDVPVEINYEKTTTKDEPSCFVIIDNRKDMRTVAIQNRRKAFKAPKRVADILAKRISDELYSHYCYQAEILPEYYPEDLLKAWEELQSITQAMTFCTPADDLTEEDIKHNLEHIKEKGKPYYDESLMPELLGMYFAAKEAKYKQTWTVSREEKKEAIYVDKTSRFMKNQLTFASATGTPVELVTKDGASFRCFVDSEEVNMDKVVHQELDENLLEMLFDGRKKNGEKAENDDIARAEAGIVEMLNGMKHTPTDQETDEEAA